MIDLRQLREDPGRFREGARLKGVAVDVDRAVALDGRVRELQTRRDEARAAQNRLAKESGPRIGQLMGRLKKAAGEERAALEAEIAELKAAPAKLKGEVQSAEDELAGLEAELRELLLAIPLPPDPDVPVGTSAEDNVELRVWAPAPPGGLDPGRPFAEQRGFAPKTHIELVRDLGLCDFERGVKVAGSRSYSLTGDGMLLQQAALRYAFDFMVHKHGFSPRSVPVLVREEAMVGTGFFPAGREQTYHVGERERGAGEDLFLAGTGEVGLMGLHAGEILDEADLPLRYVTWSPCYRREAGAAGKDTAGLYRIHQFEKVEQVVICRADEAESRAWHREMLGFVEELLQSLELPYRLLQCCTGDLGVKNADMIDIECWMPGRSALRADPGTSALRADSDTSALQADSGTSALRADSKGAESAEVGLESRCTQEVGLESRRTLGAFGETHSASRLYDYQCRRLNMRYRAGGEGGTGATTFCHSLNNTVIASPRILIPLLEVHQQEDGSVRIPEVLRAYMGGRERIG